MVKYLTTRIFLIVLTTFVMTSIVYYVTSLGMIMKYSSPAPLGDDMARAWEFYMYTLERVFRHGDFGTRRDGMGKLAYALSRVPVSLRINLLSMLIYIPAGLLLGIVSALYQDHWIDRVIGPITLIFGSVPTFIIVFFLIMVFGFVIHLFPPLFMWGDWYDQYWIPLISLSLYPVSRIIRIVRGELLEALQGEELLLLKAKGLNRRQIIFRHLLRQSMVALFPQIMELFLFVMMLSFIVEKTYQIPGIAKLFLDSIVIQGGGGSALNIDTMMVSLITCFYTLLTLSVSLINDVVSSFIDPRIELYQKKRHHTEVV